MIQNLLKIVILATLVSMASGCSYFVKRVIPLEDGCYHVLVLIEEEVSTGGVTRREEWHTICPGDKGYEQITKSTSSAMSSAAQMASSLLHPFI